MWWREQGRGMGGSYQTRNAKKSDVVHFQNRFIFNISLCSEPLMIRVFNYLTEQFMLIQDQPFSQIYWFCAQKKKIFHSMFWQRAFNTMPPVCCAQRLCARNLYICSLPTGFYTRNRLKLQFNFYYDFNIWLWNLCEFMSFWSGRVAKPDHDDIFSWPNP